MVGKWRGARYLDQDHVGVRGLQIVAMFHAYFLGVVLAEASQLRSQAVLTRKPTLGR